MIDMSNDRANIAFVGEKPWHGLGHELQKGADIETWKIAAGMNFDLVAKPALYLDDDGEFGRVEGRNVLLRSDTRDALSIVSDRYNIVQPGEVLEFYRDLVGAAGFDLETAGVLAGGRRYWALASIGEQARIMGQDAISGYLMLGTSCDGSLATTAAFTSVRIVCQNTLNFAVQDIENNRRMSVKVPHNSTFDPQAVKTELGLAQRSWQSFVEEASKMATRKVSNKEAVEFLVRVLGDETKPVEEQEDAKTIKRVYELFTGDGMGSEMKSAAGTTWGLVNAVTEYYDHRRPTRTADSRLNRAWFGDGAAAKAKAWDAAVTLLAA
jgi:phage/plasmid-like protein (TIGR03299 family)